VVGENRGHSRDGTLVLQQAERLGGEDADVESFVGVRDYRLESRSGRGGSELAQGHGCGGPDLGGLVTECLAQGFPYTASTDITK